MQRERKYIITHRIRIETRYKQKYYLPSKSNALIRILVSSGSGKKTWQMYITKFLILRERTSAYNPSSCARLQLWVLPFYNSRETHYTQANKKRKHEKPIFIPCCSSYYTQSFLFSLVFFLFYLFHKSMLSLMAARCEQNSNENDRWYI